MFSAFYCSYGQRNDEFAGVWKPISKKEPVGMPPSIKSIEIRQAGKNEINYFVYFDDASFSCKRIGNDLIHRVKQDTLTIHFNPSYETLKIDTKNIIGIPDDPTFTRVTSYNSTALSHPVRNTFFDFNIDKHQSGVPENAIPRIDWIQFGINHKVILANNITSLKIPVYKSSMDTANSELTYLTEFEFNSSGDIVKLDRTHKSTDRSIKTTWDFIYRDDRERSLEKILFNKNNSQMTFNYDTDSWQVDDMGQKVITSRLEWTLNKSSLPIKLLINTYYKEFIEFLYDDSNNLIQAVYMVGKSKTIYYFHYSGTGILKKVNIVEGA